MIDVSNVFSRDFVFHLSLSTGILETAFGDVVFTLVYFYLSRGVRAISSSVLSKDYYEICVAQTVLLIAFPVGGVSLSSAVVSVLV